MKDARSGFYRTGGDSGRCPRGAKLAAYTGAAGVNRHEYERQRDVTAMG